MTTFSSRLTESDRTSGRGQGQLDILLGLVPVKESWVEGTGEIYDIHSLYMSTHIMLTRVYF